jgi:site-specific recombinase XerD
MRPPGHGGPIDPRRDWGEWKDLLKAAGVRDARVHDARHSAATAMLAMGMDMREVMEWLGHSQISVTSIYTHIPDDVMRERAAQMDVVHRLQPDGATRSTRRSS